MPLKFITIGSKNYFGIKPKLIDENLDYLVDRLTADGKILPTWQWDKYLEQWEISRLEWMGILTLESLLSLLKFYRIKKSDVWKHTSTIFRVKGTEGYN